MDRRAAWVLGLVFGGLFLCLFAFLGLVYAATRSDGGEMPSGDHVGVVEIVGAISDSKKTLKELEAFRKDPDVKAIVVRIDSPGGSVGPSQEIYDEVMRIREKKKVYASMGSIAASGGFYIASAAEKVYANPGTLTGSIGVIFQMPNVQGLMHWAGVDMRVITAGKMKDSGSPFREMTAEERAYFEGVLADVHQQFIHAVAQGRKLKDEDIKPIADGRIFTGRQAKDLKLVDELGGLQDAVAAVGKAAGLSGEPKVEYPKTEKKLLKELLGGDDAESMASETAAKVIDRVVGTGLQVRMPLVDVK